MIRIAIKIALILVILNLLGCSAQKFYVASIETERSDANLEKKTIQLDFGEVTYLENGVSSKDTVVLIHGFGGDKDIWNQFSISMENTFHVISIDLPGHGKSISTDSLDYSIKHQSQMLDVFLKAKDLNNIHLVGNSMGGAIALSYAGQFPQRIKSLTLIDSLGLIKTKSEIAVDFEATGNNALLNICSNSAFKRFIDFSMQKPPFLPDFIINVLVKDKCARAKLEKIIFDDMVKDSDLTAIAKKITIPTLILWGKKDRVLHIDNAKLFNNTIKNSKLIVFDDLGHVPLLEDPDRVALSVKHFIQKVH